MKTILCFGDSNTWGADPVGGQRFSLSTRWPGVLRQELGDGYWVVEEGLPGRTTVWPDPIEGYKSGKEYLIPCLESHKPIDLVIIMLGTNDLKARFSLTAQDIAAGAGVLVRMVQQSGCGPNQQAPKVLLIIPPPVGELSKTLFVEMFAGAEAKSQRLASFYRQTAAETGCPFLDAGGVVTSSPIDGIHLEVGEHLKLGKAVARQVEQIFI
jgi:lysophospholipase L1-like esterase